MTDVDWYQRAMNAARDLQRELDEAGVGRPDEPDGERRWREAYEELHELNKELGDDNRQLRNQIEQIKAAHLHVKFKPGCGICEVLNAKPDR